MTSEPPPEGVGKEFEPDSGGATCAPAPNFRLKVSDLILIFGLSAVALLGVGLLGGFVRLFFVETPGAGGAIEALLVTLSLQALTFFAVIYVMVIYRHHMTWADLGLKPTTRHWYAKALLAVALAFPLTWAINAIIQVVLGRTFVNPQLSALAPEGFSWTGLIGMLVLIGLVFPLAEEILFRGILYRWLRGRVGVAAAAGVSGVAFAGLHAIPELIPAIAVLGVILALLYELSGSLWTSVLAHAVYNTINVVLLYSLLSADIPLV